MSRQILVDPLAIQATSEHICPTAGVSIAFLPPSLDSAQVTASRHRLRSFLGCIFYVRMAIRTGVPFLL